MATTKQLIDRIYRLINSEIGAKVGFFKEITDGYDITNNGGVLDKDLLHLTSIQLDRLNRELTDKYVAELARQPEATRIIEEHKLEWERRKMAGEVTEEEMQNRGQIEERIKKLLANRLLTRDLSAKQSATSKFGTRYKNHKSLALDHLDTKLLKDVEQELKTGYGRAYAKLSPEDKTREDYLENDKKQQEQIKKDGAPTQEYYEERDLIQLQLRTFLSGGGGFVSSSISAKVENEYGGGALNINQAYDQYTNKTLDDITDLAKSVAKEKSQNKHNAPEVQQKYKDLLEKSDLINELSPIKEGHPVYKDLVYATSKMGREATSYYLPNLDLGTLRDMKRILDRWKDEEKTKAEQATEAEANKVGETQSEDKWYHFPKIAKMLGISGKKEEKSDSDRINQLRALFTKTEDWTAEEQALYDSATAEELAILDEDNEVKTEDVISMQDIVDKLTKYYKLSVKFKGLSAEQIAKKEEGREFEALLKESLKNQELVTSAFGKESWDDLVEKAKVSAGITIEEPQSEIAEIKDEVTQIIQKIKAELEEFKKQKKVASRKDKKAIGKKIEEHEKLLAQAKGMQKDAAAMEVVTDVEIVEETVNIEDAKSEVNIEEVKAEVIQDVEQGLVHIGPATEKKGLMQKLKNFNAKEAWDKWDAKQTMKSVGNFALDTFGRQYYLKGNAIYKENGGKIDKAVLREWGRGMLATATMVTACALVPLTAGTSAAAGTATALTAMRATAFGLAFADAAATMKEMCDKNIPREEKMKRVALQCTRVAVLGAATAMGASIPEGGITEIADNIAKSTGQAAETGSQMIDNIKGFFGRAKAFFGIGAESVAEAGIEAGVAEYTAQQAEVAKYFEQEEYRKVLSDIGKGTDVVKDYGVDVSEAMDGVKKAGAPYTAESVYNFMQTPQWGTIENNFVFGQVGVEAGEYGYVGDRTGITGVLRPDMTLEEYDAFADQKEMAREQGAQQQAASVRIGYVPEGAKFIGSTPLENGETLRVYMKDGKVFSEHWSERFNGKTPEQFRAAGAHPQTADWVDRISGNVKSTVAAPTVGDVATKSGGYSMTYGDGKTYYEIHGPHPLKPIPEETLTLGQILDKKLGEDIEK